MTKHWVRGDIHMCHCHTKLHLKFFAQPTDPPLKTYNVEHTESIRNTNPLVISDTFKIFWFLILKDSTWFYNRNMKMKHWMAFKITCVLKCKRWLVHALWNFQPMWTCFGNIRKMRKCASIQEHVSAVIIES